MSALIFIPSTLLPLLGRLRHDFEEDPVEVADVMVQLLPDIVVKAKSVRVLLGGQPGYRSIVGRPRRREVREGVEVHLETQMHERREQIVRDLLLLAPTPLQLDLGLLLHLQLEAEELL
jgi:hypothetical protein